MPQVPTGTCLIMKECAIKIGPVMVSRPRLYARTPPIQNLDETEVAWEKMYFFIVFFFGTFFHKKVRARVACGLKIWNVE